MMGCSQTHWEELLVHVFKPRGAWTHSDRRESILEPPEEQTPCLSSSSFLPGEPQHCCPGVKPKMSPWITFQAKGVEHMGHRRRAFWGYGAAVAWPLSRCSIQHDIFF